jgi:hypothetical protein
MGLIGTVIEAENMISEYTHFEDEESDRNVVGVIIERVNDDSYLVMDKRGRLYEIEYGDINRILRFNVEPSEYLTNKL